MTFENTLGPSQLSRSKSTDFIPKSTKPCGPLQNQSASVPSPATD